MIIMAQSKYFPKLISRDQMIRYHKGDEKKFVFPVRKNWLYQLALQVTMVNVDKRIRPRLYGQDVGANAHADYAYSLAHRKFDFNQMYNEAIDKAYDRIGGSESEYDPVLQKRWRVGKVHKIYIQLRRYVKPQNVNGHPKVPKRYKDVQFMVAKKKPSKKALEKKYPSPKKYVEARKNLCKKIAAQKRRASKKKK